MRIALAQINLHVGHFEENTRQIIQTIRQAESAGADLVVFSELTICGYPPKDLLYYEEFLQQCRDGIEEIATYCKNIAAIVGGPDPNPRPQGNRLYNAAFFLEKGRIAHTYHKGLLPTYNVFDEGRYFEPAISFQTIPFMGHKIALTICEDIWNLNQQPLYDHNPMDFMMTEQPDLMINISASPFSWNRVVERMATVSENARNYKLPLFYVNQYGAQAELIFDGGSAVFDPSGNLVEAFEPFSPGLKIYDLQQVIQGKGTTVPSTISAEQKNRLIHQALVLGIRNYFSKLGIRQAIVGLSGGLDSALVLVLAVQALGNDNVRAVLMPGPFSTDHSVKDALQLAENLGVKHDTISIDPIVSTLEQTLEPWFKETPFGIAEENLQARARAVVLMGLSNKFGPMVLNTSNKSEAAVGYGTLYGDMAGGLSVIGDVYKTEAYDLARYINTLQPLIPENILTKPPSAELRPDQKDTDSLPEYEVLDAILFRYIEQHMGPGQIVAAGYDSGLVARVIRMVNASEYKRMQAPPILRVSSRAFGSGRLMPLAAKYF
ncbi:MAG: NAD+ synthase [Bacteroidales bacterium]